MRLTAVEMADTIGRGLLSFPITDFDAHNRVDVANYRSHCAWLMEYELAREVEAQGADGLLLLPPYLVNGS